MTASVYLDRIDVAEVDEIFGVVVRMVRRARVIGVTNTDYQLLLVALQTEGVPAVNSKLAGAPNLILTQRKAKLVDDRVVDIDLVYELGFNEGQSIDNPPFGLLLGECQATINQSTSNKDKDGNTVYTQHTFPDDDPDFGINSDRHTQKQGGEFPFFQPQFTLKYHGLKSVLYPALVAQTIMGTINLAAWAGGEAGTWMCTGCTWKPHNIGSIPNKFLFTFEFQFNADGWNPTIIFNDERTGKPPSDLIEAVGYKTVQKHTSLDFETVIGARVQGG